MSRNSWKDYSKKGLGFGKKGFDKAWQALDKLGAPVNRLSNRVGAEAFWPTTLDKESEKAARILRSFCKDGFYEKIDDESTAAAEEKAREEAQNPDAKHKIDRPAGKQRVLVKIPSEVIKRAKGIAIFTTMRTGLWFSGAGGSGILMARVPETGEWSPPSGIMLHTAALGFLVGVDIYDCVVIINTYEALEGFKKLRATLGGELSATAGPIGMGGVLESEVHKRQAPIWTYMKSRGLYAGIQVDGTIIVERTDENARFYGRKVSAQEILAGQVTNSSDSLRTLFQTVRAAQGDRDVDESYLPPPGESPSDAIIVNEEDNGFGIPASDDPDPYGVRALEEQGLFIREAGTHVRPTHEVFEFRPSPTSPIYNSFVRQSIDSSPRQSWRASVQSTKSYTSTNRGTQTTVGTQTDDLPPRPPPSDSGTSSRSFQEIPGSPVPHVCDTPDTSDSHEVHEKAEEPEHEQPETEEPEEFEIHEASNTTLTKRAELVRTRPTTPMEENNTSPAANFSRPRLVTIPKRIPPALPPRNPERKHDSVSTQESFFATSPSPTQSVHPDIRDSRHDLSTEDLSYETPEITTPGALDLAEKTSQLEVQPHVHPEVQPELQPEAQSSDVQKEAESETAIPEKEEFHSSPSSPTQENPPAVPERETLTSGV
ncbi:uncharacterized protein TRUGW13939_08026 [Talaromyces rugulosus]|uniref:Ysc84 actin-binding domain-containing protein n=1 Tax=Talaromyces rugulosus TaxID=121627 RepID=A0A7H8R3B4_TALRU|nr:uncharacterized protein TRUGW13939_08026 [Talaromyces rugulosus]QKX60880.1 hypothetical protein TRUGW13939_08026 [Talaromyces rugulosus]